MSELNYKAGDWVVWSDFHDYQSDDFRRMAGEGPFLVKEVTDSDCVQLADPYHKVTGHYSGRRFKYVNRFLKLVETALAEADRG